MILLSVAGSTHLAFRLIDPSDRTGEFDSFPTNHVLLPACPANTLSFASAQPSQPGRVLTSACPGRSFPSRCKRNGRAGKRFPGWPIFSLHQALRGQTNESYSPESPKEKSYFSGQFIDLLDIFNHNEDDHR
jgi:hypothetical protein